MEVVVFADGEGAGDVFSSVCGGEIELSFCVADTDEVSADLCGWVFQAFGN